MSPSNTVADRPLAAYFLLVFALAWPLMGVAIAQHRGAIGGTLPLTPMLVLGSWIPNIAAFLVLTLVVRRKGGLKALLKGWTKFKVGPLWYLVAVSPVLVGGITIGVYRLIYGSSPATAVFSDPASLVALLVISTLTGATGEELGWRGFALPRLQMRMNALVSSLLLGSIWVLWHLPLWFAGVGFETIPYGVYAVIGVSSSVLITWACNNARGSMVIASLFHLFLNVSLSMIERNAYALFSALFVLAAVVVVIVYGPRKLARAEALPIDRDRKSWVL